MKSLVLELQNLAQLSSTDIPELLRRAKVVASKLGLEEASTWIDNELDGYAPTADLPAYRRVPTELRATNSVRRLPVELPADKWLWEIFGTTDFRSPVAELSDLVASEGTTVRSPLNPAEMGLLRRLGVPDHVSVERISSRSGVAAILDAVRNLILKWALELEHKGILGEGMTFTAGEKMKATSASVTINHIFEGPVVHGDHAQVAAAGTGAPTVATNSQIGAIAGGPNASASGEVRSAHLNDLAEIRGLVEVLLAELRTAPVSAVASDALDHAQDLKEELARPAPKQSKLKASAIAIGAGLGGLIKWTPKAVDAFEKIKHLLGL